MAIAEFRRTIPAAGECGEVAILVVIVGTGHIRHERCNLMVAFGARIFPVGGTAELVPAKVVRSETTAVGLDYVVDIARGRGAEEHIHVVSVVEIADILYCVIPLPLGVAETLLCGIGVAATVAD